MGRLKKKKSQSVGCWKSGSEAGSNKVASYRRDKQSWPPPQRRRATAARHRTHWSWRSRNGSSCGPPWRRWPPWRGAGSHSGSGAGGYSCIWAETRSPRLTRWPRPLSADPLPWQPLRIPPSWSRSGTWACWAPRSCSGPSEDCLHLKKKITKYWDASQKENITNNKNNKIQSFSSLNLHHIENISLYFSRFDLQS